MIIEKEDCISMVIMCVKSLTKLQIENKCKIIENKLSEQSSVNFIKRLWKLYSSDVRFSYPSPASSKNPCGVSSYKNNEKRHKMILLVKVLLQKRYKKIWTIISDFRWIFILRVADLKRFYSDPIFHFESRSKFWLF